MIKAGANYTFGADLRLGAILQNLLNPFFIGGVLSFGIALGAYSFSLTKFPLSVAYPLMTGLGFILVAFASVWYFKESLGIIKILGMAITLIGIILIAISK